MKIDMHLDYDRGVPIYRQIYEAVLRALANGRLEPSDRLPTIHELAGQLAINPNTVVRAYKELERAGHIVSKRGRGTFASDVPALQPFGAEAKQTLLREIYERAMREAANHSVSQAEVVRFFQDNARTEK